MHQNISSIIEIMAPVGSPESLSAAIQARADSVYLGVGKLNMRSRSSSNFSLEDLAFIAETCGEAGIRTYVTLNTVMYDHEMEEMKRVVDAVKANGITAVIASDIAVLEYARSQNVEVHISTQCNITNLGAVKFYARYADVMVTARELSLQQVKAITDGIREQNITGPSGNLVQIEVFAHGALCMAVSGKCYLSLDNFNQSANRGECLQPCRRGYKVTDLDGDVELAIDNEYIMSPKDLCTIGFLDQILDAGVSVLKIEGRGRPADYVRTVASCYKEASLAYREGTYTREKVEAWMERLSKVYNRGFWDGYYLGRKMGEWTSSYGSKASQRKVYIGMVTNYFGKPGVAEIKMETQSLKSGDSFMIIGPSTGVYEDVASEIRVDDKPVIQAIKGEFLSIATKEVVRRGDKVYVLEDVEYNVPAAFL